MNPVTVKDIARSIVAAMTTIQEECTPAAARHYHRLALITYRDFLQRSPERSEAMNAQCLEEAHLYGERAISFGVPEAKIEESFERLRRYWIPRLAREKVNA